MPAITFSISRSMTLLFAVAITVLVSIVLGDKFHPIGWNYIALFILAGIFTFFARGTYQWIGAVWLGALLGLYFSDYHAQVYARFAWLIIAVQFIPAVLTGGLFGQWLRFQLARRFNLIRPQIPSSHTVLASAILLLALPVLSFILLARVTIDNLSLLSLFMFAPGNTPFIFPGLITAALCGHWLRQQTDLTTQDRQRAMVVIIVAYLLLVITLAVKFIFGWLVVATYNT